MAFYMIFLATPSDMFRLAAVMQQLQLALAARCHDASGWRRNGSGASTGDNALDIYLSALSVGSSLN